MCKKRGDLNQNKSQRKIIKKKDLWREKEAVKLTWKSNVEKRKEEIQYEAR